MSLPDLDAWPTEYAASWGTRTHPRPITVPGSVVRRTASDLETLFHLATSLPDRLFGGDPYAYCRALGMPERRARFLSGFNEPLVHFGRADLYLTSSGEARLLEWNLASDLGGTDRSELNRLVGSPQGTTYVHTGVEIVSAWANATGLTCPRTAIVCAPGRLSSLRGLIAPVGEMLDRLGVPAFVGELSDLNLRGDRVALRGEPIDLVWRFFHVDDLLADTRALTQWDNLYAAHQAGGVHVWTLPHSSLLSSKALLPFLSSSAVRAACTATEIAAIDRLLPASWQLDGPPEKLPAPRERLVLKPVTDLAGHGVFVGAETTPVAWQAAMQKVKGRSHILQERVVPRTEASGMVAVIGMFMTPGGFAGLEARVAPQSSSGVINFSSRSDVLTAAVFVEEP